MKIDKIRVANYKSFQDSDWIELAPGFNVVVGKNNSGKSALLEAFKAYGMLDKPHRSSARPAQAPLDPKSRVEFGIVVRGSELRQAILQTEADVYFPIPNKFEDHQARAFVNEVLESDSISLTIRTGPGFGFLSSSYPSHGLFQRLQNTLALGLKASTDKQSVEFATRMTGAHDSLTDILRQEWDKYVYVFRAERLNIGRISAQETKVLMPDGSNLPAALMSLQSNQVRFEKFNKHVREIFPSIERIGISMVGTEFEVRVWPVGINEREDLAIALQESGTGVGQALAILYVVMTIAEGIIVIDEPNSFLHPGAAKKLMEILKQYNMHQYIITTHSADLIASSEPSSIQLVSWSNGESTVEQMDSTKIEDLRRILVDVGVSLSDVFGFDRIIWVEGPTEEQTFPLFVEAARNKMPLGLIFRAVRSTSDFALKAKHKTLILDLYNRLSAASPLLPTTVRFGFDKEGLTETEILDLRRSSNGQIMFLPRRAYENYLIHSDAIAAVMLSSDLPVQITEKEIAQWLTTNGMKYGPNWNGDLTKQDWLEKCDAPKLLHDLFIAMSQSTLEYRKTIHSAALTKHLLEKRPAALSELSNYVLSLLP